LTAYFDTSAAVKLVVEERGSSDAARLWDASTRAISSIVLYPEARAALKRAHRERRLTTPGLGIAIDEIGRVWDHLERVGLSTALAIRAGELAHAYDLRGYDAVHLAAAEAVASPDMVFVAADRELCAAAARLGLATARIGR
jgi:hypothetical protein